MARQRSDFPDFDLDFSTLAGSQIEPTPGEKTSGFALAEKVPARYMNWLWDAPLKWLKMAMASAFGTYTIPSFATANDQGTVVWSEVYRLWVSFRGGAATTTTYTSIDGTHWVAGSTKPSTTVSDRCGIEDTTGRVIYGATNSKLGYKADPTAGAYAEVTPGFASGAVVAVRVKDGSDFIMASSAAASEIATASDVTSAWTVVTTPGGFVDLTYVSGSTWLGMESDGTISISTNDGTSWAAHGDAGTPITAPELDSIDIDPGTGILCASGRSGVGGLGLRLVYSVDTGQNWTLATISPMTNVVASNDTKIRNLGGRIWVVVTDTDSPSPYPDTPGIYFSIDAGVTWKLAERSDAVDQDPYDDLKDLDYNGAQWLAVGDTAQLAKGHPVPRW
jgi:hypothetical protein